LHWLGFLLFFLWIGGIRMQPSLPGKPSGAAAGHRINILIEPRTKLDRDVLRGIYRFANTLTNWEVAQLSWDCFPRMPEEQQIDPRSYDRLRLGRWMHGQGIISRSSVHPLLQHTVARKQSVVISGDPGGYPQVWVDDERLGETVAEYFLARGYWNYAFVSDPTIPAFTAREKGFSAALQRADRSSESIYPRTHELRAVYDVGAERRVVSGALRRITKPAAVACPDAAVGRRVIQACRHAGLSVPHEVSIVSCDYDDLIGMACRPQLSGVDVPGEAIGYQAASLLQDMLDGTRPHRFAPPVLLRPGKVVTQGSSDAQAITEPCILKALDFMERNVSRSISVDAIASHAGVHRRTLEQRFRRELGQSPYRELRRLRLRRAHDMITRTDMTMTDIAARCGYCHLAHLDAHFLETYGCAPTEYRRVRPEQEEGAQGRVLTLQP
jgi:LacI family transcriptional regulator